MGRGSIREGLRRREPANIPEGEKSFEEFPRRRVLHRGTDVAELVKPTWEEILGREYHPWSRPHLVIDSLETPPDEAAQRIASNIVTVRQERASA